MPRSAEIAGSDRTPFSRALLREYEEQVRIEAPPEEATEVPPPPPSAPEIQPPELAKNTLGMRIRETARFAARRPRRSMAIAFSSDRQALALVAAAWIAAIGVIFMANSALKAALHSNFDVAVAARKVPPVPTITYADITPERLRALAENTRTLLGPASAIRVDVNAQGRLSISADNIKHYRAWQMAIRAAENSGERLRWQIVDLCVGTSCTGFPLRAEMTARTANIK